jgi:hypothetical protein
VIHRDVLGHARLEEMLDHIGLRLSRMALDDPEIEMVEGRRQEAASLLCTFRIKQLTFLTRGYPTREH